MKINLRVRDETGHNLFKCESEDKKAFKEFKDFMTLKGLIDGRKREQPTKK
jgi:hypothetical protein